MTCQVVLFNGYGAVLASDSASTVAGQRVYDTAEKICSLPEPHQMAALHNGNAFLHQFPVQLLLEEFGRTLGSTRLASASAYWDAFVRFVENGAFFSEEIQEDFFLDTIDDHLRQMRNVLERASGGEALTNELLMSLLNNWINHWDQLAITEGAEPEWAMELIKNCLTPFEEIVKSYFKYDDFSDEVINRRFEEIIYFITRCYSYNADVGVAFIGFGANELMPSYAKTTILGFMGDKLQHWGLDSQRFDPTREAIWGGAEFLAQSDAIRLFVRGTADDAEETTRNIFRDSLGRMSSLVVSDDAESGDGAFDLDNSKLRDEIRSEAERKLFEFGNAKRREFLDVISVLPPATLVNVAESLIGLQSLWHAVRAKLNTVGGPIDIAIVTRNDGFQWVKHKSLQLE